MGEIADEMIDRMIDNHTRVGDGFRWKGGPPPPAVNCRTAMRPIVAEEGEIVRTPTNTVCPFCQKGGLHWSVVAGKNRLREEGGWLHSCKPVEGVTLNLI